MYKLVSEQIGLTYLRFLNFMIFRMESFFIAETLKYLYLLFDEDHWLHQNEPFAEKLRVDGKGVCLFHKCKIG